MSKLVRFDPFAEMDALQRHFFNDDNWMPRQVRSVGLPTTDVYMKDNALPEPKKITVKSRGKKK